MNRPARLNALTSLRFFAAFLIVLHHSFDTFGFGKGVNVRFPTYQAVSFFFILSGFILTYVYQGFDSKKSIGHFYIARIARIWPLHLFCLFLTLISFFGWYKTKTFGPDMDPAFFKTLAANFFLVQAWVPSVNFFWSFNAVSWSISTEFAFYLLFPILIYKFHHTWKIKLFFSLFLSIGVAVLCRFGSFPEGIGSGMSLLGIINIHPIVRLFEFVAGMTAGMFYIRFNQYYSPGKLTGSMVEFILLSAILTGMALNQYFMSVGKTLLGHPGALWVDSGTMVSFFNAMFILVVAMEKGWLSRYLSKPVFVFLGEISFSIYLLHQIFIKIFVAYIKPNVDFNVYFGYPHFLIVLFLSAYVVWELIEKPFRRAIISIAKEGKVKSVTSKEIKKLCRHKILAGSIVLIVLLVLPVFIIE